MHELIEKKTVWYGTMDRTIWYQNDHVQCQKTMLEWDAVY